MGKSKADKLFKVYMASDREIYVIARHGKGALTIAQTEYSFGKTAKVKEVNSPDFMCRAVNYKVKDK